jgi:hypothetical protein
MRNKRHANEHKIRSKREHKTMRQNRYRDEMKKHQSIFIVEQIPWKHITKAKRKQHL